MKRALFIALVVLAAVVGVGSLVYAFGTPQAPVEADAAEGVTGTMPGAASGDAPGRPAEAPSGGASAVMGGVPSMGGGDPSARGKKAPKADPDSPLAIQIPGCVCHSDDPKLVEEHAGYRMNQCFGCHSGGDAGGG